MARKMVTARALQMRTATAYAITGLPQAVARKMVTARAGTDVIDNIKTF